MRQLLAFVSDFNSKWNLSTNFVNLQLSKFVTIYLAVLQLLLMFGQAGKQANGRSHKDTNVNLYPTALPYGNGMVLYIGTGVSLLFRERFLYI